MKPETIENPCIICGHGSRGCGHSKQDRRAHTERTLAARRKAAPAPKRKFHRVPAEGPGVFPHEEGHSHAGVWGGTKLLRVRMSEQKPVRHISPEEYGTA